jgi:chromate transporter
MLVYFTSRWSHQNRDLPAVKAFKTGLAPVVIALLISTGWLLAAAHGHLAQNWPLWAVSAISTLLVWKTRLHLLWLLGAGALLGALGYV